MKDYVKDEMIGHALRSARKSASLSQAQLAVRLNHPQSYVSKIETGERSVRLNEVLDYTAALGMDEEQSLAFVRHLLVV